MAAKPAAPTANSSAEKTTEKAKETVKTAAAKKTAKPKVKTLDDMADEDTISRQTADLGNWIAASGDNRKQPYAIVDKERALIMVFDATGKLKGQAPVLIGAATGDYSAEGVADRELKDIPMEDRTTPAGRFVSGYGPAAGGEKVLWIEYDTAISIHPVLTSAAAKWEKRQQRLASKTWEDNRISHGCINVAANFYANTVRSTFKTGGIFYILPDTISMLEAFPAYEPPQAIASIASGEAGK